MTSLISGKEALRALADGKTVEVKRIHDNEWQPAQIFGVSVFTDSETTSFRIKPHTIAINGIEVPAPFEPKDGDEFWILFESHYSPCGYKLVLPDSQYSELCYGAWRTEDEIKQVVEALRQVFGIRQILTEDKFI